MLNAAISLRARCTILPRQDRRIVIVSEDTGDHIEASHWSELRDTHELRFCSAAFRITSRHKGLSRTTGSQSTWAPASPVALAATSRSAAGGRSGAGRSALPMSPMQIAMNVEAQAIDVPTGVQDYRPALYGGVSAVELRY